MRKMVCETVGGRFDAVLGKHDKLKEELEEKEEYVDFLNAKISGYIVSMMSAEMSSQDAVKLNGYYRILGNLERISDHAMNVLGYAGDLKKRNVSFTEEAQGEIREMKKVSLGILDDIELLSRPDAKTVLENTAKEEQRIDDMRDRYQQHQLKRMSEGRCSTDASLLFSEMLTDFERIGDHALNVAEQYYEMM